MPIVLDTKQRGRARVRRAKAVSYTPTAAQAGANGEGPWLGFIANVDAPSPRFPAQVDLTVVRGDASTAAVANVKLGGGLGQAIVRDA